MALSTLYGMTLSPADVARVLGRAKVRYVLVGALAINLYTGKPRATQDVDVITGASTRARRALQEAYPDLTVEEHPVLIRFKDKDREVLDLIKSRSGKLFGEVLRQAVSVRMVGTAVRVANLEAALATKFASMSNSARSVPDRLQDVVDFSRAATFHEETKLPLLHRLGELTCRGGGDALLKLIGDVRAGRRLDV